ncbi:hypothetical protein BJP34_32735 [Moorena producens PAL-8-15-08-1]|uniref:Uncharacterized protein n=1 Tax=Moorena producens PAL-8-15-08-1 TaxID=1458985 RepID=A0A1D8U0Y9_9CYAN|nr:hypothetical protein BJP34_32735 [Moorena producens PAL-8-15-08-1]
MNARSSGFVKAPVGPHLSKSEASANSPQASNPSLGGLGGPHKGRFFTFGSCPTPNPRPFGGGSQGEEKENNE